MTENSKGHGPMTVTITIDADTHELPARGSITYAEVLELAGYNPRQVDVSVKWIWQTREGGRFADILNPGSNITLHDGMTFRTSYTGNA